MKKQTLLLLLLSLLMQNIWALGLSQAELHSHLGQPLYASIVLIGENIDSEQLRVNLASGKDYERLGIDKSFSHYDLQFALNTDNPKQPSIEITSTKPINEPFLHFAMAIKSPQGNLVKAVTLLLAAPGQQSAQSVFSD